MVNSIQRDQRRRLLFSKFEMKRTQYRALLQDASIKGSLLLARTGFNLKLHKMSTNSSKTRIRNRCILTGRGRGVLRICKISRIRFRELASQGILNGVIKASW